MHLSIFSYVQDYNAVKDSVEFIHNLGITHFQQYHNSFTYTGNFVFYGLTPSTEYEVIIQSRNREGWADPNDIFRFSTRSKGEVGGFQI